MCPQRRLLLTGLLALPFAGLHAAPQAGSVPLFALTSPQRAASLRERTPPQAQAELIKAAQKTLDRPLHLMSLVRTSGLLDGEGTRAQSQQAQEDWRQARLQALAWRLSGKQEHLDSARRYVLGWTANFQPSYNPIDETDLSSLLFAYDLIADALDDGQREQVRRFGRTLATGYLAEKVLNGGPGTARNNWHSHRIKLGTAGAYVSGEPALIVTAQQRFAEHIPHNIHDDGLPLDFEQRDALHYVVYTLEPLLMAALMAQVHGEDWYGANKRLGAALAWLEPYAKGSKTHEEFVHSSVSFDRKRAATGVPGFAGEWQRNGAATVYQLAACFDMRYAPLAGELHPPAWVQTLFAA